MDGWANTKGFDSCSDLLLQEHSCRLDTPEIKSLDTGCVCVVPRVQLGTCPNSAQGDCRAEQYVLSSLNFGCSLCPFLQYLLLYPFPLKPAIGESF